MKLKTFLTNGVGVTSTSANHIANIAKEMYSEAEQRVTNLSLYETRLSLIGDDNYSVIKNQTLPEYLKKGLKVDLDNIARLKLLISWLREAIKYKSEVIDSFKTSFTYDKYLEDLGVELNYPTKPSPMTIDEYFSEKPIEMQLKYYKLSAIVTTHGAYVHPDGEFAEARKDYYDKLNNPTKVEKSGVGTLIEKYVDSNYETGLVDNVFFNIQKIYRNAQKELNSLLFDYENYKNKETIKIDEVYSKELMKYKSDKEIYNQQYLEERNKRLVELQDLKIVIPAEFQDIVDEINNLG